MFDLTQTYLKARASVGLGNHIMWWAIPIGAVIVGIVLFVWDVPLLLELIDGANFY